MPFRRIILCAAALTALCVATVSVASSTTPRAIARLVKLSEEANAALMRGDVAAYSALITLDDDFTLMSPFGGTPTRGALPPDRMAAMGRFFRNGTLKQELVAAYAGDELAVLAVIERAHVEVGGLPAQDWALRVTLVYRREGGTWRLLHRHADPIVDSMSLAQAAAIARGERLPPA